MWKFCEIFNFSSIRFEILKVIFARFIITDIIYDFEQNYTFCPTLTPLRNPFNFIFYIIIYYFYVKISKLKKKKVKFV